MPGKLLVSLGGLACALLLAAAGIHGQTARPAKPAKPAFTPPRTPWGDPDLQGLWPGTSMMGVPPERPLALGGRDTLTDDEFAARLARAKRQADADDEAFVAPRPGGGRPETPAAPVTGANTTSRSARPRSSSIRPTAECRR